MLKFARGDKMSEGFAAAVIADGQVSEAQSESALHFASEKLSEELSKIPPHLAFQALSNLALRYPSTMRVAFAADFTGSITKEA